MILRYKYRTSLVVPCSILIHVEVVKLDQKNLAISLRKEGVSYNEIRKKINVSKGTLSLWLRDIELTQIQKIFYL